MKKRLIKLVLLAILIVLGYQLAITYNNVKNVLVYRTMVKEILDEQDLDNENETVVNSEENTDAVVEKKPVIEVTEETIEEESK